MLILPKLPIGPTLVGVRHCGITALASDGQTADESGRVLRSRINAIKLFKAETVLVGWCGPMIAGVEGLHDWREYLHRHPVEPESILRFLSESPHLAKQPTLIGNHEYLLGWDGLGNWLEPEDGVLTLGPGAQEVKVAACSLVYHSSLSATEIARESIRIASRHSVWINDRVQVEGIATPDVGF